MKRYYLFLSIILLSTQTYALRGKVWNISHLNASFDKIIYLASEQFQYNGWRPISYDTDPWFEGRMNSCESVTAEGAILRFRDFIRYNLIRTNKFDQVLNHFFKMESDYWICKETWSTGKHGSFHNSTRKFFLGKKGNIRFALTLTYIQALH